MNPVERSPTVQTLLVFVGVFLLQALGGVVGLGPAWFVLAAPLDVHPWTLVTSVYAHGSVGHLLANGVAFAVLGFTLERATTRLRFHAFVVLTGMVAGVAEVVLSGLVGDPTGVLGASGAVFAMLGYLLVGNPVTAPFLSWLKLSWRTQLLIFAGIAAAVTVFTAASGVALIAHFTGFLVGLVSGRLRLLRVGA